MYFIYGVKRLPGNTRSVPRFETRLVQEPHHQSHGSRDLTGGSSPSERGPSEGKEGAGGASFRRCWEHAQELKLQSGTRVELDGAQHAWEWRLVGEIMMEVDHRLGLALRV